MGTGGRRCVCIAGIGVRVVSGFVCWAFIYFFPGGLKAAWHWWAFLRRPRGHDYFFFTCCVTDQRILFWSLWAFDVAYIVVNAVCFLAEDRFRLKVPFGEKNVMCLCIVL